MGEVWPGSKGWRISFHEAAICLHRCADIVYVGDIAYVSVLSVSWGLCLMMFGVSDRCSQSVVVKIDRCKVWLEVFRRQESRSRSR